MDSENVTQLQKASTRKNALTETEAARYIGMSIGYLRQDRLNGPRRSRTPGPPFVRVGRAIRYLLDDLDTWLQENRVDRRGTAA